MVYVDSPFAAAPTTHERQWAALAHAGALALALLTSWTAGFARMLAAIAVYLLMLSIARLHHPLGALQWLL